MQNKNLCGRDGRTICGPQCVPKSTSVTLAVDEKTLPMATITGRTDRRTDRVRRNMRPPPREEGRIIILTVSISWLYHCKFSSEISLIIFIRMTSAALNNYCHNFLFTFTKMTSSGESRIPFVIKFAHTDLTKYWPPPPPWPRRFGLGFGLTSLLNFRQILHIVSIHNLNTLLHYLVKRTMQNRYKLRNTATSAKFCQILTEFHFFHRWKENMGGGQ